MLVMDQKYSPLNRYSDILPYAHSRVKLVERGLKGDPDFNSYINANYIDSPLNEGDRKIIRTQGPKGNTFVDFWRMIAQENVTLVVTTCNLVEKMRSKCHRFWPEEPQLDSPPSIANEKDYEERMSAVGLSVEVSQPEV